MEGDLKNKPINIVFIGPSYSGKSCIVAGYQQGYKSTIGVDFAKYNYVINNTLVSFNLWDISASMTFAGQNLEYCKKGDIVACVYSANDHSSFQQCQQMIQKLAKQDRFQYNAKLVVISTKNDLQKNVPSQQGEQMAQILRGNPISFTQAFFQISTKTDPNARKKICTGIYDVYKDTTIKTIAELIGEQESPAPVPVYHTGGNITLQEAKVSASVQEPKQIIYKLVLLGDDQIGKTSIMRRFVNEQFSQEYMTTIGVDFAIKKIQVQGVNVKLQIWDTAGMKKFRTITTAYIKGCQIFFVVYDSSNIQSFDALQEHVDCINKFQNDMQINLKFIVANKIDQEAKVSKWQGLQYAKSIGYEFMEVSAKDGTNISQLFYNAVDLTLKNKFANPN